MALTIASIVIGIALGVFNIFGYKTKVYLNKLSDVALYIMLFCLGAKLGCDRELLAKLSTLGVQSLVLGGSTILGSMACTLLVSRLFKFGREGEQHGR